MSILLSKIQLRQVSLHTVPTVLVADDWLGGGIVDDKVPTQGSGYWISPVPATYENGTVLPGATTAQITTVYHSDARVSARFTGQVYSGTTPPSQNRPLFIYARSSVNNSALGDCYRVSCNYIPKIIVLSKTVNSVTTILNTFTTDTAHGETVGLQVSGSVIQVYYQDSVIMTVTDTSIASSGYWGFGLTYGESGEISGFSTMGPVVIQTA
jgi:hypothetical protein